VAGISTSADGVVTATVQNIASVVNTSMVTLTPMSSSSAAAVMTGGTSQGLYGWICGGTGTNVPLKYLPGSCRGG
jgi:type IV pilus assembly protein PilA